MALTMKEKQAVTKQLALKYKRARKKDKGKILDTVIELAGYNRSSLCVNMSETPDHRKIGVEGGRE